MRPYVLLSRCQRQWYCSATRTTSARAGRIVVPKPLRDAVGLVAGQEVEVAALDGRLEITVAPTPMHLETRGGPLAAGPQAPLPRLPRARPDSRRLIAPLPPLCASSSTSTSQTTCCRLRLSGLGSCYLSWRR